MSDEWGLNDISEIGTAAFIWFFVFQLEQRKYVVKAFLGIYLSLKKISKIRFLLISYCLVGQTM